MRRWPAFVVLLGTLALVSSIPGTAIADPEVTPLEPLEADQRAGFGGAVAVARDTLVIGAPSVRAVFVFGRSNGRWSQRQRIANAAPGTDAFGSSVAIDGTRILIGAPAAEDGDGKVYVYDLDRTRALWTERQALTIGSSGDGHRFGERVAIDGDVFAISAPGDGAVYMFRPTLPDVWLIQKRVVPSDPGVDMRFGAAIALDQGTLVASAPGDEGGLGAVYVFDNSGRNWVEREKLASPRAVVPQEFGSDVDLDGATILVGAASANTAFVFERREDGVELLAELAPRDTGAAVAFGAAVSLAGGTAVVADPAVAGGTGAMSVFARVGDTFRLRSTIVPPNDVQGVELGFDLAIHGDLLGTVAPQALAPDAAAFAIDLRERTEGYLAPVSAKFVSSPGKKSRPGLTVTGILDLGPDPVVLGLPGTLRFNDTTVFFGPLTQSRAKKPFVFDDGTTTLSIKPSASGSSKASFVLTHSDGAAPGVLADGPLAISIETTSFAAAGTILLVDGAYSSRKGTAGLVTPHLVLDKLKVKAKGAGKGSFKINARFPGGGETPDAAPLITVRLGEDFEETIPAERFKRKKSKWTFKDTRASGVASIVVDYAKGKVTVVAKKLSLLPFSAGPTPVAIGITVDGVSREAKVTARGKGTSLSY
jgi:hypothetical protein